MDLIRRHIPFLILIAGSILLLLSCARQGSLSGGPKDLIPPKLDTINSDKNFQTQFYPQTIRLFFDEWIQLKNKSQILISPPLKQNPKINFRGKHVEIIFDKEETLRDSTTYSINFGNAIVDYTESNALENFQFVFSTGDQIDSLILIGNVIDAYTRKPVKDVVVMLYDEFRDSIVYDEKPYYFSKTDKTGNFIIRYLRPGTFKCFALLDADYNFLYNQDSESIGFPDSLIYIREDSLPTSVQIELFQPTPKLKIIEKDIPARGKIKLRANRYIDSIRLQYSNREIIEQEIMEDSLIIWYRPDTLQIDSIHLELMTAGIADTLELKSKRNTQPMGPVLFSSFRERKKIAFRDQGLNYRFGQIIQGADSSLIVLRKPVPKVAVDSTTVPDSLKIPVQESLPFTFTIDTINPRELILETDWVPEENYEILFLPGAIRGFYDNVNDTLISGIRVESPDNLGTIRCLFSGLDSLQHYLVLLEQRDKEFDRAKIYGAEEFTLVFSKLNPGKYQLKVIEDSNANGRWDPGDYRQKRQSERKVDIPLEELRKNWDIESEIKWEKP